MWTTVETDPIKTKKKF